MTSIVNDFMNIIPQLKSECGDHDWHQVPLDSFNEWRRLRDRVIELSFDHEITTPSTVDVRHLLSDLSDAEADEEEALRRLWLAILMDPEGPMHQLALRIRRVNIGDEDGRLIHTDDLHFYRGFASVED